MIPEITVVLGSNIGIVYLTNVGTTIVAKSLNILIWTGPVYVAIEVDSFVPPGFYL